jgi:hypothetical protein
MTLSGRELDVAEKRDWSIALYGIIALVVVGGAMAGMWATGLLDGDNTGAGLAFGGTLLTGAVSFVGLVLKHNSDRETAAADRREKERLDIDAATRAANLLSNANGNTPNRATTAGALLSLVRLGQVGLATSMLFDLWGDNRISPSDATFIVNKALLSNDEQAQRDASNVLFLQTPLLTGRDEEEEWYYWPYEINHRWMPRLPIEARYTLLRAWVYLWTASSTKSTRYRVRNLTAGLLACWREEKKGGDDETLKSCIARMLHKICNARPRDVQGAREMVGGDMVTLKTKEIKAEAPFDRKRKLPEYLLKLEDVLDAWLEDPDRNRTRDFQLPEGIDGSRKRQAKTRSPSSHRSQRRGRPHAESR